MKAPKKISARCKRSMEPTHEGDGHKPKHMPRSKSTDVKKRRRRMDLHATLDKYAARLAGMEDTDFQELEGAWITTFRVYGTLAFPTDFIPDRMRCNATILAQEATRRGVRVCGVTSERKKRGQYICSTLTTVDGVEVNREDAKCVYVGQYSYFTSNVRHPVFSLLGCDRVLMPLEELPESSL